MTVEQSVVATRSLHWQDVSEGDRADPIRYELSLLRLVSFVRATGLYDYVHFDCDYARAAGARDVFISTPHVAGLFSRLVTDWAGPDANLRSLSFRLHRQILRNDILTVSGSITRRFRGEDGSYLVEFGDLVIATGDGPVAASAQAVLELPVRGGPTLPPQRDAVLTEPSIDPSQLPDFARALAGTVTQGHREPARPLTADEVHLWCESLEDWNPLYWDEDHAAQSRYGRLIAPHVGMFFGAGSSARAGIGYLKPGATIPDAVRAQFVGLPLLQALRQNIIADGSPVVPQDFPEVAVVEAAFDFFAPLAVGDTLRTQRRLLSCSPLKRTRLGEGYFMTFRSEYHNQRDELTKTLTMNLFYYRV